MSAANGDGYATVRKALGLPAKSAGGPPTTVSGPPATAGGHDAYRYVRSSAMNASGRGPAPPVAPKPQQQTGSFGGPIAGRSQLQSNMQQHMQSNMQHSHLQPNMQSNMQQNMQHPQQNLLQQQQHPQQTMQHPAPVSHSMFNSSSQLRMQQPLKSAPSANHSPNSLRPVPHNSR